MMDISQLKKRLMGIGAYCVGIDNTYDTSLRNAIMRAMTEGPDYPLEESDFLVASRRMDVEVEAIKAVRSVEASANPFISGRPTILFEPHRFSRATRHRYDDSHPRISSRHWDRSLYPKTQAGRWNQLIAAVELDVDAAFSSASYGAFQILGENYRVCKVIDPFSFAWQEAQTEADQLEHFCLFVEGNRLDKYLRNHDWARFAKGYNGTAFRENHYDTRLAIAYDHYKGSKT